MADAENTGKPLSSAERRMIEDTEKVNRFLAAREENATARGLLGRWAYLRLIPYPQQAITLLLGVVLFLVGFRYVPNIVDWIVYEYLRDAGSRTLFMISVAFNIVLAAILGVIMIFARQVVKTWVKAGIMKRPILQLFTKNRNIDFIVPKEVTYDMWTLKHGAIVPDPNSIEPGPHQIPMMMGIPEWGFGFSIRNILAGLPLNIDMTSIDQHAELYERRAIKAMRTGMDWLKPMLPVILILVIVGLIFGPWFYSKMSDMGEGATWRNKYELCRVEMLDSGVVPKDIQAEKQAEKQSNTEVKPAVAPAGVS